MSNDNALFFDINNTHIPKVYSIDKPIKIILTVLSRSEHKIILDSISGVLTSLEPIQIDKGQALEDEIIVQKEIMPFRFFTIEIMAKPKGAPKKIKLSPIFHYTYQSKKFHYNVGEFLIIRDDIYFQEMGTLKRTGGETGSIEHAIVKSVDHEPTEKKLVDILLLMKIVLMGDGYVGKTALKIRFVTGRYNGPVKKTIGVDLAIKNLRLKIPEIGFDSRVVYQVWDLGGQQRFNIIRKTFYQGAKGGVFVFDITRPATLESLESWIDELLNIYRKIPLVVVANKVDLCMEQKEKRCVSDETIRGFLDMIKETYGYNQLPFFKVSAMNGYNVDLAFKAIGELIIKNELLVS